MLAWKGSTRSVLRLVWEMAYGPLADDLHIGHSCAMHHCVNPDHLVLRAPRPLEDRFWEKVDRSGGDNSCWLWTSALDTKGYGVIQIHGKTIKATRVAYQLTTGPIPPGLLMCHTCDNPPCVNPRHLYAGSYSENGIDASQRGRLVIMRGEDHIRAKLTNSEAEEVRRLYRKGGFSQREIGERYGLAQTTVSRIVRGKRYASAA